MRRSTSLTVSGLAVKAFLIVTTCPLEESCSLTKSTTFFVFPELEG